MSQNNNLIIGSPGIASQANTVMIGNTPAATSGTNQTDCYIGGIYGSTIGATNSILGIDNQGKLGTVGENPSSNFGSSSFFAYQSATVSNINGVVGLGGSLWRLGTNDNGSTGTSTLSTLFNNGGGVIVSGNASTPFSYSVPATGIYFISFKIWIYGLSDQLAVCQSTIIAAGQTFAFSEFSDDDSEAQFGGDFGKGTAGGSTIISLNSGDTITFTYYLHYTSAGHDFHSINAIGSTNPYQTFVYGYRIA